MRVMLDTHIHDQIVQHAAVLRLIENAQAIGILSMISTHIQWDELSDIPDRNKREATMRIPVQRCATNGRTLGGFEMG
jgi:hypothetical protein